MNLTLEKVIETPELLKSFKEHCKLARCEENLFFLEDIKLFKTLDEKNLLKAAKKITNLYLRTNSFCEINVSRNKLQEILEILEKEDVSRTLFQDVAFEVEWSLESHLKEFQNENQISRKRSTSFSGLKSWNQRILNTIHRNSDSGLFPFAKITKEFSVN
jgi:hypothetical protein